MLIARRATALVAAVAIAITSVVPLSATAEASGRHAKNRSHAVQGHRMSRRDFAPRRFASRSHVVRRSYRAPVRSFAYRSRPDYYVAPRRAYRPAYYSAGPSYHYDDGPYYNDYGYYRRKRRNDVGKAIAIGAGLLALGIIASNRGHRRRW